jgi:RecA-family ATPase
MTVDPDDLKDRLAAGLSGCDLLRLRSAAELNGLPVPPRVWHVPDLVPASAPTLLTGDGGVGKSVLALQLAAATVAGLDWIGVTPRQGPVMHLTAEDGSDEMHRRLHEVAMFYDRPLAAFADLHFASFAEGDADPLLCAPAGRGDLIEMTPLWDEIVAKANAIRPVLLVLDPIADMFGGVEFSRAQVRFFVAQQRRLALKNGAAVVLVGHPSVEGMRGGSGISGSTAWNNSVRSRLYLTKPQEGYDAGTLRILTLKKANYAASGAELRIRLGLGGYRKEEGWGATNLTLAQRGIELLLLELLTAFNAQGRPVSASPGRSYAPTLFAENAQAKGVTAKAFKSAMNRLFDKGEIINVEEGPPSRRRLRLVVASTVAPKDAD